MIMGYKRVNKFLPQIIPFLIGKKNQAQLLHSLCERRLQKFGWQRTGYDEIEVSLCQKICDLNGRGTKIALNMLTPIRRRGRNQYGQFVSYADTKSPETIRCAPEKTG